MQEEDGRISQQRPALPDPVHDGAVLELNDEVHAKSRVPSTGLAASVINIAVS